MPTQAEFDQFINTPELFMATHAIAWVGVAPENQAVIFVVMGDVKGVARRRVGSRFLGFGNVKESVGKFDLRWCDSPLKPVPHGAPFVFQVQWSGYKAGQGRDAVLPAAGGPDIMLTPEFTGCTAVCRTLPNGTGEFSHYNLMTADGKSTLDDNAMRARADLAYGHGHTTLTKGDARAHGKHSTAVKTTVLGLRRHGRWEFWAQMREDKMREDKTTGEQIRAVVQL